MRRTFSFFLFLFTLHLVSINGGNSSFAQDCSACSGGGKYVCSSSDSLNDMCCTGNGCPSYACSQNGFTPVICSGNWTCCDRPSECLGCQDQYIYVKTGTCEYCPASGGDGGDETTYGKITGRMFSDYNKDNQPNGSGETWSNSTATCAVYKSDTLNNTIGGSNIIPGTGWSCDGSGSYSVSNDIVTGSQDVTLVGVLPGSVNCGNVKWSYSTSPGSNGKSGSGCVAAGLNITTGANYLWW